MWYLAIDRMWVERKDEVMMKIEYLVSPVR